MERIEDSENNRCNVIKLIKMKQILCAFAYTGYNTSIIVYKLFSCDSYIIRDINFINHKMQC